MSSVAGSCPVYTIGHSNRSIAELTALLSESAIETVIDVRAIPRSRTNPQFNIEALPAPLAECGMSYRHLGELGGRRHRSRDAPPSPNTFWQNESFRNYADYALTSEFDTGMASLRAQACLRRCAVMCSEALWWRCHRRIIADYLLADGFTVLHILGLRAPEVAVLTPSATQLPNGTLIYPA